MLQKLQFRIMEFTQKFLELSEKAGLAASRGSGIS